MITLIVIGALLAIVWVGLSLRALGREIKAAEPESQPCPACDVGRAVRMRGPEKVTYLGQPLIYEMEYAKCQACGAEVIFADQGPRNDKALAEAREEAVMRTIR